MSRGGKGVYFVSPQTPPTLYPFLDHTLLCIGNFPESKIRTAPQFSLRSREKFGSPMTKAEDTTTIMEPGPGHYKSKLVNDRERNAPKYSIPKSRWLKDKDRGTEPGPGAYKLQSSCERQVREGGGARGSEANRTRVL